MITEGARWTLAPAHLPWWVCGPAAPAASADWARAVADGLMEADRAADALEADGEVSDRTWRLPERALSVAVAVRAHQGHEAVAAWVSDVRAARVRSAAGLRFEHVLWATSHGVRALRASALVAPVGALSLTLPGPHEDGLACALERLLPVLDRTLVVVSSSTASAVHEAIEVAYDAARVDVRAARVVLGSAGTEAQACIHRVTATSDAAQAGLADPGVMLGLGLLGVSVSDWLAGVAQAEGWCRAAPAANDPARALAAWAAEAGRDRLVAVAREARLTPLHDALPLPNALVVEACLGDPGLRADGARRAARAARWHLLGSVPPALGLRRCDAQGVGGWLALWLGADAVSKSMHRENTSR